MHNKRYKEIYRIVGEYITSGNTARYAVTPVPLGHLLVDDYHEVKDFVRINGPSRYLIRSGDKAFFWDCICLVDQNIFDIFTHEIIYGDPNTALTDPSSAAVSETFAKKYFGKINPIGKTIYADRLIPAIPRKITLVFRDLPENTYLKYDVLFRFEDRTPVTARRNALFNIGLYTYLVMPENYDVKNFRSISDSFFKRHMEDLGKAIGQTWNSRLGLFVLSAMTTEQRSREIAIRKVLGASALQIVLMLSRKMLWLVLAGSVVASIVAYRAMYEWLTGFTYQTGINPLVFMISISVVIAVAFITVALQSHRIATANPADMIHYD